MNDIFKINRNGWLGISSEIVSWISSPPLVGTVFFVFLVFRYSADLGQGLRWIITLSPFLIFIPLLYFALSVKLKWITDIDLSNRKERPAFLLVYSASLALGALVLFLLEVPDKFFVYILSTLVMVIIASLITLFWKISFHTAIITSIITAINILGGIHFWPLFLLVIPVSLARVYLKRHTISQVIGGILVAFIVTGLVFLFFGFHFWQ